MNQTTSNPQTAAIEIFNIYYGECPKVPLPSGLTAFLFKKDPKSMLFLPIFHDYEVDSKHILELVDAAGSKYDPFLALCASDGTIVQYCLREYQFQPLG